MSHSCQAPLCNTSTLFNIHVLCACNTHMQGSVYGRIDVIRSMNVRVDSMTVTGPVFSFALSPGVIRVALCGLSTSMSPSNVYITNNEVYGERWSG